MPLFFFDWNDGLGPDPEGVELQDAHEARLEAIKTAGTILRENAADMLNGDVWTMTISDEASRTVCALRFTVSG